MWLWNDQVRAIVRAQLKGIYNKYSGGGVGAGRILYWIFSVLWYGGIAVLAWAAATGIPALTSADTLNTVLGFALLLAFVFWQAIPMALATTGLSLDLKRLLVYPIAPSRLFGIEVLLRVSTGPELLIVLSGVAVGLARSALTPVWAPLGLLPFVAFNFLLSAGLRDLFTRLLAKRGVRELVVLGIVMISVLPQLVINLLPPDTWKTYYSRYEPLMKSIPWPWQLTAELCSGVSFWKAGLLLAAWTAAAGWFGFAQFQRGLLWDADEARAKDRGLARGGSASRLEWLYRLPGRLLPDPLGGLVEKEFRCLTRAPRFRLVFFMGFTFGILLWVPVAFGPHQVPGGFSRNLLVWISLYAALLLGEVLFWNIFGFDRTAAQAYFVMPVTMATVLAAKNIAAAFFLLLEITIVTVVILALRLQISLQSIPECYAVTVVICLFMLAFGNIASTYYPRPVNPDDSWRSSSSGKMQGLYMLAYPALMAPVGLAYLARYAFDTSTAFYAVLGSAFVIALMTYWVSFGTALEAADEKRESILAQLSRGREPIG
jgi:ABC-2 type transport system permease protein